MEYKQFTGQSLNKHNKNMNIVSNANNMSSKVTSQQNAVSTKYTDKIHVKAKKSLCLKLFATNGAGLIRGKVNSLKMEVKATGANLVMIQETHAQTKGKIAMDGFVVFEAI